MSDTMDSTMVGGAVVWSIVQAGIWVGRRAGKCVGVVEELWGHGYVATTFRGVRIGKFATLEEAQRGLSAATA